MITIQTIEEQPALDQFVEEAVKKLDLQGHLALESSPIAIRELLHRHAEYVKERCIAAVPEMKEVCGCEDSDLGYHTKNCVMENYGFNECRQQVIDNIKKV